MEKFEEAQSSIQDLTFIELNKVLNNQNKNLNDLMNQGLINSETGKFTNLALILSEQNPYSIKVATFSDKSKTDFISRKEFFGSILKQIVDVLDFISLVNNNSFKISSQYRIEKSDYPDSSIREALINSIVHRDYNFGGSSFVKFNDIDMEITSFGSILEGLKVKDLKEGVSKLRNSKLVNILKELGLVKAKGTGIVKILSDYDNEEVKPEILLSPNVFQIKLPNRNSKLIHNRYKANRIILNLTKDQLSVLNLIKEKPNLCSKELMEVLGIKRSTFYNNINLLITLNTVSFSKERRNRLYKLTDFGYDILVNKDYKIINTID